MIERFEILGPNSGRPQAERVIYCDGAGGPLFAPGNDLELSHWRPNRTPAKYRAGTSTEICLKFLDDPLPGPWTVAVNNHVDVDGILSVYVLVEPGPARPRRQAIIEAARMGDFWGWAELPGQRLFQALTLIMESTEGGRAAYLEAFGRIPAIIDGTDPFIPALDQGLAPLSRGATLVETRRINRQPLGDRLTHYVVPLDVAGPDDVPAAGAAAFNEKISDRVAFWPQVRARYDFERVCLVSTERGGGWFHDLWFPGYLWADTEGLWRVPGLDFHEGMSSYGLSHPALAAAFERLQQRERAAGRWCLGGTLGPFDRALQDQFPLVGRFLNELGLPAASALEPSQVAAALEGVFDVDATGL